MEQYSLTTFKTIKFEHVKQMRQDHFAEYPHQQRLNKNHPPLSSKLKPEILVQV